jgi:putative hydrolase of the HAD superfamily
MSSQPTASGIRQIFFDIGGVLGSNGWDREQREQAARHFGFPLEELQYRHEETVGAFEAGQISLDEYLDVTVFAETRSFTREEFKSYMFSLSAPWEESIVVARRLRSVTDARMATLNNEARELNQYRIQHFGLRDVFEVFFSSCWIGTRKPTRDIFERALGMSQADPRRSLFVDDREQNLRPARQLGMHTLLFTGAAKLAQDLRGMGYDV